jgi:hypothetical protein
LGKIAENYDHNNIDSWNPSKASQTDTGQLGKLAELFRQEASEPGVDDLAIASREQALVR